MKEGWTVSPKKRKTVPFQAEMVYPHKVKEKWNEKKKNIYV
jgi:hypothetical protein